MDIEYIIVQAGGKGTRMQRLTANKPKALVSINNKPMMFHLFDKYPDKKFIIIGDYKFDVLQKYLASFAKVDYLLVDARGDVGTCAGLQGAIDLIPDNKEFMLIWSDLILPEDYSIPDKKANYIGISTDFPCRWMYKDDKFKEESSVEYGVAGFFIFENKKVIENVPREGELVRWMQQENMIFEPSSLARTKEYGLIEEYNKIQKMKCRPFNKMEILGDKIKKYGIDEQGIKLGKIETAWYKKVQECGYTKIPKIYEYEPLIMEKIEGGNIYEMKDRSLYDKEQFLKKLIDSLKDLHGLDKCDTNYFDIYDNYVKKTFDRLSKVRDLVPFANEEFININGKKCRNVFYYKDKLEDAFRKYRVEAFEFIHGDCTFSNLMYDANGNPVLIDPRGYFGSNQYYGDPLYDWAKLYYSLKGNYDQFNLGNFDLEITEDAVTLNIESNEWEALEETFIKEVESVCDIRYMKLIHAVIWLSLTTYAWNDYDMICGAFYNGLLYLEECLDMF